MFGPNDFGAIKPNYAKSLGELPGLEAAAHSAYQQALGRAKEQIRMAKKGGQQLVDNTQDGTWNNVMRGVSGIASGISGFSGSGLSGGGGGGSSAADILTNPNINYDAGIGPGDFKFDWKSNADMWNTPFSW